MRRLRFLAAIPGALPLSVAWASCLHYGDPPVSLTGSVTLRTHFGPPNYGENPHTDSLETQAILRLKEPICVAADSSGYEPAETAQTQVTLVPLDGLDLEPYVGMKVEVSGTLFHAISGHHHTAVLITVARKKDIRTR